MPRTGKPSGACLQCKKSHVKCDEARPACGRCVKANKACSGYAEGLDLVLRSQNESAKARVDRRIQTTGKSKSSSPELQLTSRLTSPTLLPPLPESEESHAVAFFICTFALYPRDSQADRGFVELLPLLSNTLQLNSPLSLALTACSRILFSKWELGRRDIETQSFPNYGVALEATRKALQDPNESSSDETLMAVCMLGLYEAATSAFQSRISPSRHFDGAAALIKQRRNGHMTEISRRLLIAVRSNIIFRAMQFSLPIDGSSDILNDDEEVPKNPGTLLDLICVEVANLLAKARRSGATTSPFAAYENKSSVDDCDILFEAQALDMKLASWPEYVPIDWTPVQIPIAMAPKSVAENGFYGDTCDVYPDIMICSTWNEWRVARLMVLGLIVRLTYGPTRHQTIMNIQHLVDGICASVPFSLGDRTKPGNLYEAQIQYPSLPGRVMSKEHQKTASAYGGWYLFAPFKETINIAEYLREGQREWISGQLLRLAKMYDVMPSLPR